MFERFTKDARAVVTAAISEAERRGDRHVGTEHLLLGALASSNPTASAVVDALELDVRSARRALDAADARAIAALGIDTDALTVDLMNDAGTPPRRRRTRRPFTGGAKQTLDAALRAALAHRHDWIGTEHIMLALSDRPAPDPVVALLAALDVDPTDLRAHVERRLIAVA